MSSLEEENTGLKEKLEDTEDNVGDFINDMSHLLDTHEFGSNQMFLYHLCRICYPRL